MTPTTAVKIVIAVATVMIQCSTKTMSEQVVRMQQPVQETTLVSAVQPFEMAV